MEPMMSERRGVEKTSQAEPRDSSAAALDAEFPESERRMLSRSGDDEAQRIEELPTEPRHALPTYPDMDWDAPTIPDGRTLDSWDLDERG